MSGTVSRDSRVLSERPKLRAVGTAIGLILAVFVLQILVSILLILGMLPFEVTFTNPLVFLAAILLTQLTFLVVGYWYVRRYAFYIPIRSPDREDIVYIIGGVIGALALATILLFIQQALNLTPRSLFEEPATSAAFLAGMVLLNILIIAPVEEYLFRGVIQGRLRDTFGPVGAIAGASILFGLVHIFNYTGSIEGVLAGVFLITVVGAVFGILYERTGNLTVPVIAHALYNTVLIGSAFLSL